MTSGGTGKTISHREEFPGLVNKAYFNYGGQGPMPQRAIEAIAEFYHLIQYLGPFSGQVNDLQESSALRTKEAIASELKVPTATITLTEDVTVGCNIAMWGMDWRGGDRMLLTDCEHPGIVATAKEISRRFDVEVSTCGVMATLNQGNPIEVIASAVQPTTRLVILSHILWNTGQVLPLAEIVKACKSVNSNVKILVDAAQSVGILPLNLIDEGVDFYAFTGHKWWCGPEGVGGLYVSQEAREDLHPTFIGWRGIVTDNAGHPVGWKPDGGRYEIATSAYPLYAGLREAIGLHSAWGTAQERYQRICELSAYLWQKLTQVEGVICLRESPPLSGLVSFQLANKKHCQLVKFLETQNIMVRTIRDPDCVRACVHYFTLESEIERLVSLIANQY
ncbi:MAG: aminotransferase class V-fold PLP-dependent enzyme [Hormoscilla sp. GUM202]|nr:aminotransferase class V-fold PLP-dependent enzyme [Hormoscilla sp. GUM202]